MEHPDLAGTERSLLHEVPARVDVLAVRRPGRAVDEPALLARDLPGILALGIDRPDVPQPVAIARDCDAPAVRTEAGLHVERRAAGQPGRGRGPAPVDRHDVDVAEQIEYDTPAVRADVDVHPRAFGRLEGQLRDRAEIGADVPLLFLGCRCRLLLRLKTGAMARQRRPN